ncbi:MAG: prolyl oligopeptidase family serine peptidase [Gemmatimonadota bacterium]
MHLRRAFPTPLLALALLTWVVVSPSLPLAAQNAISNQTESVNHNPDADGYIQPEEGIQRILQTDRNLASLEYLSPDGDHFLVPHVNELSTLELMSRTTYRLAELELRPGTDRDWHLDTWGIDGFRFYSVSRRSFVDVELPQGSFASDFTWSPEGEQMAFLAHLPTHTEVWVADAATGRTRSLSGSPAMATLATGSSGQGSRASSMLQWTPRGTLLTLLVPTGRGAEPQRNPVPSSPVVRRTRPEPTRSPTYPNLLEDAHDEALFRHYTTSQLVELASGNVRMLGEPRMYESISLSPDGEHVLATFITPPFSYITSYRGFPRTTAVLNGEGRVVSVLEEAPLREGRTPPGGEQGPRDFAWRPDGAGISFLDRAPETAADSSRAGEPNGEEGTSQASRPYRINLLPAPFQMEEAQLVGESEDPISGLVYSLDGGHALATVMKGSESALAHWRLGEARGRAGLDLEGAGSPAPRRLLRGFQTTDDPTELPGELFAHHTGNGLSYAAINSDGSATFTSGPGYAEDFRPTPFVDRIALSDGAGTRVFQGSKERFEQPLVPLDSDFRRMVVRRESMREVPDSYLWESGGWGPNLTANVDPFPEITAVQRRDFSFTRRDGLEVQGRVSMPVGWQEGDPPVPALFWTYPREYERPEQYERAAIRARNVNAFNQMSWLRWSDIWLAAGYALVDPDIPIVGENYNDTYIASLVDAMYAAIRAVDGLGGMVDVDRMGHGGHSYGAFATANLLANAPYFKAGIAGDGAYNRSLTPDGFQAERRNIWEAPNTYIEMSPFFRAHQINTPLLLYHGGDDNNTGTFPLQSRRLISALTILGKEAVLYEYPYESHTPRAMENKLDMWARMIQWMDEHVKGGGEG